MTTAEIVGTSNRVIAVDLTTGTFEIRDISDRDRLLYLGGKGLGLMIAQCENCHKA